MLFLMPSVSASENLYYDDYNVDFGNWTSSGMTISSGGLAGTSYGLANSDGDIMYIEDIDVDGYCTLTLDFWSMFMACEAGDRQNLYVDTGSGYALEAYWDGGDYANMVWTHNTPYDIDVTGVSSIDIKFISSQGTFEYIGYENMTISRTLCPPDFTPDSEAQTEDFEDDTIGNDPSEDWYTVTVNDAKVSGTEYQDGTHSLYFADDGDDWEIDFDQANGTDELVCDFWVWKGQTSENDAYTVRMENASDDNVWGLAIDDTNGNIIRYENSSGWQDTTDMWLNETWMNVVVRMNFTAHTWNYACHWLSGSGDLSMYYSYAEDISMPDNCDDADHFEMIGWNGSYLDNLSFYKGHPIVIEPHDNITNGTTDVDPNNIILSVNISDPDFVNGDYCMALGDVLYFYMAVESDLGSDWGLWTEVGYVLVDEGMRADGTVSINASANFSYLYTDETYYWFVSGMKNLPPNYLGLNTTFGDKMNYRDSFPSSGLFINDFMGKGFYCWMFNTTESTPPTITGNVCGNTYTAEQWRNNHTLCLNVTDPDGDIINLDVWVYNAEQELGFLFKGHDWGYDTNSYDYYPILNGICNETVCLDLSRAVPFNNMNYSIKIQVYEQSQSPELPDNTSWCNFSIGTYEDLDYYVGVRALVPEHHEQNGYDIIGHGFEFDIISSLEDGIPVKIGLANYLKDSNNGTRLIGINTVNALWGEWQDYYSGKNIITVRGSYKVFMGVKDDDYPVEDVEFSCLYDDCFMTNWTLIPEQRRIITWVFGENAEIYKGLTWDFHTFPEGEDPWTMDNDGAHDETWGDQTIPNKFKNAENELNFGYLGAIAGLLLIFIFSIIPFIVNYKVLRPQHKKNLPLPVQASFTLMGVLLAYQMGFFPLWIIAVIFSIVLILGLYVVVNWVKGRANAKGGV